MWIFMSGSFLSIVAHRTKPDVLLVRARQAKDIPRAFPWLKPTRTPNADYLYRAEIPVSHLAAHLECHVRGIAYDNFKNTVKESTRKRAYTKVWEVMAGWQPRPRGKTRAR